MVKVDIVKYYPVLIVEETLTIKEIDLTSIN